MTTAIQQYSQCLHTLALTVSDSDRFQPAAYLDMDGVSFGVVDTARTDEFGDEMVVATPDTLQQAIETAHAWTATPERAGNAYDGSLAGLGW